ncbi:Rv2175c family DNA-binding protein [Corynebacterium pilosum]|uniref:Transcriptional regulator n=1 Tax=Corynebacterium pilosum TaxID=35756 RepID=A0A376CIY8_9CORY|nr:Rv2175c family DNA-binding protein [Corynebacterium pilosum]STC68440.1 transcriptional regulator [Corynebacterium pilosum]
MSTNVDALLSDEELLTFPQVADQLAVPVTKVHDLVQNSKLVKYRKDGKNYVPAALFDEHGELTKFVSGVITVLADNKFSDEEILEYLFTEDESLPGRPVDGLHGHLAREVIRRAQAMAF